MATNNSSNINAVGLTRYDGAGSFSGVTTTDHNILLGAASNGITNLALTNGQLAIGSTGADPSAAALTAGTGITTSLGAGSITINAVGGGITWTVVTGTSQTAAVNSGYIANNAGLVTVTLPAVSAVGDVVEVTGINNATGWKLAQPNAGTQVFFGSSSTTVGVTGFLSSTATRDSVKVVCMTANLTWNVTSSVGNITVS